MRKNQWFVYSKFQHYLDKFIQSSIINSFLYFIAKHNLKIIYSKTITQITCKKLISRVI